MPPRTRRPVVTTPAPRASVEFDDSTVDVIDVSTSEVVWVERSKLDMNRLVRRTFTVGSDICVVLYYTDRADFYRDPANRHLTPGDSPWED